ncbi:MAG: DUF4476 domain-containing protein [Chitinophagaceae bacterium]|nr:DUF4476 domain-containing protein [Chitinophagaceae bacterium]
MKTIFTLITSMLLSITLFANNARNKSTVMVKSVDNADIRVVLDGKQFEPNGNALVISNVDAGRHQIKVYRQSRTGFLNILGKKYEVVYNSDIQLKNRTQLMITIDRGGFVNVTESRLQNNDGRFNDRSSRDFDFARDGKFGDYDNRYTSAPAMSARDFDRVLDNISREWLESNKLKSAVHVVSSNNLSTDQVKEVMRLFQFEANKLEVAKQSYRNVVDKWNFREVYTLLSFQASKTELDRYIR